jgi:hypothetical protein
MDVRCDHFLDNLLQTDTRHPAEFLRCLAGVSDQGRNFRWTEVGFIDGHEGFSRLAAERSLFLPRTFPLKLDALCCCVGNIYERPYGFRPTCGQNKRIRRWSLQDTPHAVDIFFCRSPIAFGCQIPEQQRVAAMNDETSYSGGYLASDEFC